MKKLTVIIFSILASISAFAYLTPGGNSGGGGGAPSGPAGGDLTGTYPNPTLAVDRVDIAGDTMTGLLRVNSTVTGLSDIQAGLAGVSSGTLVTCTASGSNCGSFAQVTNGESRLVGPAALSMYSGGNERLSFSSGGVPSVQLPYSWPFTARAGDTMTGNLFVPSLNGVTSTQIDFLAGASANIQSQIGLNFNAVTSLQGLTATTAANIAALQGATATQAAQIAALQGATSGVFVRLTGDTMTGNFGTQQVRLPFGTSPGTILYGNDTDTGPYQTGDGEYYVAANGFPRVHVSQNYTEFLGPVTASSSMDIGGTLTAASINYPPGSVDLTTDVTGILPFGNGGTGVTGFGPTGSIPFNNGSELDNDWANLNYDTGSGRLTVPQVFQNVTLNSVTSGVTFESLRMQPTLSGTFNYFTGIGMGATLNGVTVSNAVQTFDFSNVFNGDNSSPNGVLDFNIHHDFRNNEGYVGGFKSLAFSNNFNDHDYVTLIDSNNVVGVTSNIANYKIFDMHDQVLAGATVNNYVALNHTITNSGGMGSYTGINDQPNFIVSPSSYIGINIAAQGGVTVSDPIALNLSTDSLYSSTALNRPKAIQHNGKGVFSFTSNTTLPNSHPSVVDSINNMISVVRTEPGSPLSGTGSLGWNFGGFIDAQANVSLDPIGAGINAAGWVSLVGISSGVTVAQAGGTISVPVNSTGASSGATGGHLSAFKHYQAFPFFTGGGSNTLGDNWGFSVPSGFCGGITGECYGIHLGDSGAKSYLAGPVTLGLASDTVPYLDGATTLVSSSVSGTELGYLDGVTASLQTQINAILSTDSGQDAAIAALQGTTSATAAEIAALQGVTSNTWLPLVGGTLSGTLFTEADVRAQGLLHTGKAGSGTGGRVRYYRDSGAEGWRAGFPGSVGATGFVFRDMVGGADRIEITTAGSLNLNTAGGRISIEQNGGNTSLETVALSGTSTFISNTTITANSYPFIQTVGAANVSPWLIGVSAGTGYSVGATGAGTAKVFIVEGQ